MGFRQRTIKTYEHLKTYGQNTLEYLARQTNASKSSVHRQKKTIERRASITGSTFFETAEGEQWLNRLLIAALFTFGLQADVGAERISSFFSLLSIGDYVATSASTINRLENQLRQLLQRYQEQLKPTMEKVADEKELIAGADETFFERFLILVFMDLPSGFIILEEQSADRKASTWLASTESFVAKFKHIRCLVSDRAKALIKLSKDYSCDSIADLFHMLMKPVNLLKFSFSRQLKSLDKQERLAKKELDHETDKYKREEIKSTLTKINGRREEIIQGQATYRKEIRDISTTVHPFALNDKQHTSQDISDKLHHSLTVLRSVACTGNVNDKYNAFGYFEKQISPLSSLTDGWWQWVEMSLAIKTQDAVANSWVKDFLLPSVYWQQQIKKSKANKELRELYKALYTTAQMKLDGHPLTDKLLTREWIDWAKNMCSKYQRTTSALEGRNGQLSLSNHSARGMTKLHLISKTIIHNFWITRDDGTTAAERLFGIKPPDLFEWLVEHMDELPLPRQRNKNNEDKFIAPLVAIAA